MLEDEQPAAGESPAAGPQMGQAALALNMEGLSYEQYFRKLAELAELMRQHWRAEQRVKTLKVAIQLAKLLADASQMKLYARKFKLITDCLDEFGRLVHQRVHSIAHANKQPQPQPQARQQQPNCSQAQATSAQAPLAGQVDEHSHELAKDICRNWFLKVASIRELVPRFYIELAILSSCDILFERMSSRALADSVGEQFYAQTLRRLSRSAWGLGEPVVALHARAYLCRLAERLIGWRGLTRESLLFELLFTNLKSGAHLIGRLHSSRPALAHAFQHNQRASQQAQQQPRPSPAAASNRTTMSAGQQDLLLYFDLVSAPMQSILNVVTIRCDDYADERDFVQGAHKRLQRWALELLDDDDDGGEQDQRQESDAADGCCAAFGRNVLLQSLFRALPGDVVAGLAPKFAEKLVDGQRAWINQMAPPANAMAAERSAPARGEQLLIGAGYSTLASFIAALDVSDGFEATATSELKRSILEAAEELFKGLVAREGDRLSTGQLRAFRALVSYANHYREERLDRLLESLLARLKRARQYVHHYAALLDTIKTLFAHRTRLDQFKRLACSRPFCRLFELLRKDEHKQEAARWILETMRANIKLNYKAELAVAISERPLVNFLLKVFETLNESLSPLTAADDLRHLCELVVFFVDRFELEAAGERLELYSRLRKCVSNLHFVLEHLVRRALELELQHRKVERRRGARQNFLNGCLAYALVTTPAVAERPVQLELYQLACERALEHMSLSLADYFVKRIVLTLSHSLAAQPGSPAGPQNKRPPCEQQSNPNPTTRINQNDAHIHEHTRLPAEIQNPARPAPNALLANRFEAILQMLVKHQEHVDLKHKLALGQLLHECAPFDRRAQLLQMSSRLTGPAAQFEFNGSFNNNAQGTGGGGGGGPSDHDPQPFAPPAPPPLPPPR